MRAVPRQSRIKREITARHCYRWRQRFFRPKPHPYRAAISPGLRFCASCMYELITEIITPSHSVSLGRHTEKVPTKYFFLLACSSSCLWYTKRKKINFFLSHTAERQNNSVFAFVAYVRKVKFHEKQSHRRKHRKKNQEEILEIFFERRRRRKIAGCCWKRRREQGP